MQVLNKHDKEQLVVDLHRQGKTIREIAHVAHLSFTDIGKIIRKIDGQNDDNVDLKNSSKDTQALQLFSIGKTPLEVAIELDLPATEVHNRQEEFWALNQLYELAFVYDEIKYYLPSFLKLFHSLKERKMLDEKHISKFLKYADQDLPYLSEKIQRLTSNVIDLEFKKKQSKDVISIANTNIAQLRDISNWYQRNIDVKKQILTNLDAQINQKIEPLMKKQ